MYVGYFNTLPFVYVGYVVWLLVLLFIDYLVITFFVSFLIMVVLFMLFEFHKCLVYQLLYLGFIVH